MFVNLQTIQKILKHKLFLASFKIYIPVNMCHATFTNW
jgi:hypothetical protein